VTSEDWGFARAETHGDDRLVTWEFSSHQRAISSLLAVISRTLDRGGGFLYFRPTN